MSDSRRARTRPARVHDTTRRRAQRRGRSRTCTRAWAAFPLLLVHGYPETKRIWWRNIAPLAAAGFEVIAPDLRGYGDSDSRRRRLLRRRRVLARPARARARRARPRSVRRRGRRPRRRRLLRPRAALPGLRRTLCFFNTLVPLRPELLEAAGVPPDGRGRSGRRPTTSSARAPTPMRSSPSSTRPSAGGRGSPTCTGTGSGPRRDTSAPTTSTS